MSGIEVAGIALAVIPIAVSVIQEYRKICEAALLVAQPGVRDAALIQVYQEILYEATRFRLITQRLSRELYVPWVTKRELQQVVSDPDVLKKWEWRDAAMRHRLNTACGAFEEFTAALLKSFKELRDDDTLGLPAAEKSMAENTCREIATLRSGTAQRVGRLQDMRRRVRFLNKGRQRRTLLAQIATFNTRLDTLLNLSTHTIPELIQIEDLCKMYKHEVASRNSGVPLRNRCIFLIHGAHLLQRTLIQKSKRSLKDFVLPAKKIFKLVRLVFPMNENNMTENGWTLIRALWWTLSTSYLELSPKPLRTARRGASHTGPVFSDAGLTFYARVVSEMEELMFHHFHLHVDDLANDLHSYRPFPPTS